MSSILGNFFGIFIGGEYWLTRLVFQRSLAFIYLIAFLIALNQFVPLLGQKGLLPVQNFVNQTSFKDSPSLFFFSPKDWVFKLVALLGIGLALFALSGYSEKFGWFISIGIWGLMWLFYLSFVNVGQTFYAFGWETMLLEAGFLAMFLGDEKTAPSLIVIFLLRWMLFRTMFGAGLIKIRGDSCWKDLTCLYYHYETQPMPNLFSWYFNWLPKVVHQFGVLFNHFTELIVPFFYFAPQPVALVAGLITLFFHGWLSISGNFAFLGFLTMVIAIPTLNDNLLGKIFHLIPPANLHSPPYYEYTILLLAALVISLSIKPIINLISPYQAMNTSYGPLHLVNSYGAFGSITRPRYEVIVQGTNDSSITAETKWLEYEFKGKPGDIYRPPPQVAPYHLRLDWLMWFAGFTPYYNQPWFVNLVAKLLQNDQNILSLIAQNPFSGTAPKYVRALLYEYHFTTPEERDRTGAWWSRKFVGDYFPVVSLTTPDFLRILKEQKWLEN